jgi:hypothetical protein
VPKPHMSQFLYHPLCLHVSFVQELPPRVAFRRNSGPVFPMKGLRYLTHWTHTVCRTVLDEWSARRRKLYLKIKHSQKKSIHPPGGIRTHNPSKQAAENPTP